MYERFTDRARKVVQLANQEAIRFNHEFIGTEHVLLGLLKEGNGLAANLLKTRGVNLSRVRDEIEKVIIPGPEMLAIGKLPMTPRTKKVFEHAVREANSMNHNYVGTEHILLGLLHENEGVAAAILAQIKDEDGESIDVDLVREAILTMLGQSRRIREVEATASSEGSAAITEMHKAASQKFLNALKQMDELLLNRATGQGAGGVNGGMANGMTITVTEETTEEFILTDESASWIKARCPLPDDNCVEIRIKKPTTPEGMKAIYRLIDAMQPALWLPEPTGKANASTSANGVKANTEACINGSKDVPITSAELKAAMLASSGSLAS